MITRLWSPVTGYERQAKKGLRPLAEGLVGPFCRLRSKYTGPHSRASALASEHRIRDKSDAHPESPESGIRLPVQLQGTVCACLFSVLPIII